MPAPKKNQFWKLRSSHGREKIFTSPKVLEAACYEYFDSVSENPLKEQKVFGNGKKVSIDKVRPFTLTGLYIFLDINRQTWENYKLEKDFLAVIQKVESVIYTQKFEAAAAGLLKENIISRELGLSDQSSFKFENLSDEQLDDAIRKILNDGKK